MSNIAFVRETVLQGYEKTVLPALSRLKIEHKPDGSFVTQADKEMERFLRERLLPSVPGSVWIGEETYDSKAVLPPGAPFWTVDPIDGTASIVKGGHHFGTMIALYRGNEPQFALVYRPFPETWLVMENGRVTYNGAPVAPYLPATLTGSGSVQCHRTDMRTMLPGFRHHGLGNMACIDCIRMTLSLSEFSVFDHVTPWDLGAPLAINRALGGVGGYADGSPHSWTVTKDRPYILARNRQDWETVATQLVPAYWP